MLVVFLCSKIMADVSFTSDSLSACACVLSKFSAVIGIL